MSDQILKIVRKHQFVIDSHGISYQIQPHSEHPQDVPKRQPVNYWTLDLEKKVAFLYTSLKEIDKWIRFERVILGESTVQKEASRQIYYEKVNLFYNHLQSYRVSIETVMDDKEHQQYMEIYIYFVNQIEDRTNLVMEMTKPPSFWDWFSI
jgi:hypothetical protein